MYMYGIEGKEAFARPDSIATEEELQLVLCSRTAVVVYVKINIVLTSSESPSEVSVNINSPRR